MHGWIKWDDARERGSDNGRLVLVVVIILTADDVIGLGGVKRRWTHDNGGNGCEVATVSLETIKCSPEVIADGLPRVGGRGYIRIIIIIRSV